MRSDSCIHKYIIDVTRPFQTDKLLRHLGGFSSLELFKLIMCYDEGEEGGQVGEGFSSQGSLDVTITVSYIVIANWQQNPAQAVKLSASMYVWAPNVGCLLSMLVIR